MPITSVTVALRLGHFERQLLLPIPRAQDQLRLELVRFSRGYSALKATVVVDDGIEAKCLWTVRPVDNHSSRQIIGMPIDCEAHPLACRRINNFQSPFGQVARDLERRRGVMVWGMGTFHIPCGQFSRVLQADIRSRQRRQVGEKFFLQRLRDPQDF